MTLNPILTSNKDYEKKLSETIARGTKTDRWWQMAIGMKMEHDNPTVPNNLSKTNQINVNLLESYLKKLGGNDFIAIKHTKEKNGQDSCIVSMSNFEFKIIPTSRILCYFCYSYIEIKVWWYDTIEEFAKWILKENEEMPSFRKDWEEHCLELRKRILIGNVDEIAVKAFLNEKLGDKVKECKTQVGFTVKGGCLELSYPPADILFRIPTIYTDWQRIVETFADVVMSQTKQ